MAKINTYEQDESLQSTDKLLGTDSDGSAKNYSMASLTNYFAGQILLINDGMPASIYDTAEIEEQLVGLTASQTLTNKTMNFSSGGTNSLVADSSDVLYNNAISGLSATNTKLAIDELSVETTGWGNYSDSRYTVISPYDLTDGDTIVLPNDCKNVIVDQVPSDVKTLYYSKKLTVANSEGFVIGDIVSGNTSGARGNIADIVGNNLLLINTNTSNFTPTENITASLGATSTCSAIDAEPAITGRNGDGIEIVIEFKAKPMGSGSNPKITTSIDIGGSVGNIYTHDFFLNKGNEVEHYYLNSFKAFTLSTWESNGGKITLTANGEDLAIYDYRVIIHRTHKAV